MPIKLVVHPHLLLLFMALLAPGTSLVWMETAVLLAALPTATNVFVIAQQYGVWQERASSAVVLSTRLPRSSRSRLYLYLAKTGYVASAFNALSG